MGLSLCKAESGGTQPTPTVQRLPQLHARNIAGPPTSRDAAATNDSISTRQNWGWGGSYVPPSQTAEGLPQPRKTSRQMVPRHLPATPSSWALYPHPPGPLLPCPVPQWAGLKPALSRGPGRVHQGHVGVACRPGGQRTEPGLPPRVFVSAAAAGAAGGAVFGGGWTEGSPGLLLAMGQLLQSAQALQGTPGGEEGEKGGVSLVCNLGTLRDWCRGGCA